MDHLKNLFNFNTIKVGLATVVGVGATLSNIDLIFRILVGAASFVYICSKLWKLWTGKEDTKENK